MGFVIHHPHQNRVESWPWIAHGHHAAMLAERGADFDSQLTIALGTMNDRVCVGLI